MFGFSKYKYKSQCLGGHSGLRGSMDWRSFGRIDQHHRRRWVSIRGQRERIWLCCRGRVVGHCCHVRCCRKCWRWRPEVTRVSWSRRRCLHRMLRRLVRRWKQERNQMDCNWSQLSSIDWLNSWSPDSQLSGLVELLAMRIWTNCS